jgi:cytochrome c biogenesis protein CcmG/thiol:disulfide interchange protein DsbE
VALAGLFLWGHKSAPQPAAMERKPAPPFTLRDARGQTVRLSDYRGKVVLLDFFATWCGPCKIEIPWFIEFERRYKDRGFSVIGVAMDDEGWDVVRPYVVALRMNYRVLVGDDATGQAYGGIDALPTTFLIDREGNIVDRHVGVTHRGDFEDGIERLLEDGGAGGTRRAGIPPLLTRPK